MTRPRSVVALYPGSFDPITLGHEDIARRALSVADRLIVAVAHTSTHDKRGLFSVHERVGLIREVLGGEDRIEVQSFEGLLVDFARGAGASLVVRGLRAVSDFEYELQMAQMNQELWPEIETVFLVPEAAIRSSRRRWCGRWRRWAATSRRSCRRRSSTACRTSWAPNDPRSEPAQVHRDRDFLAHTNVYSLLLCSPSGSCGLCSATQPDLRPAPGASSPWALRCLRTVK